MMEELLAQISDEKGLNTYCDWRMMRNYKDETMSELKSYAKYVFRQVTNWKIGSRKYLDCRDAYNVAIELVLLYETAMLKTDGLNEKLCRKNNELKEQNQELKEQNQDLNKELTNLKALIDETKRCKRCGSLCVGVNVLNDNKLCLMCVDEDMLDAQEAK
jgi:hypothetical protein